MKAALFTLLLIIYLPVFLVAQSAGDSEKPDFGQTFEPDQTFEGSDLSGWHSLGDAEWSAENSEIIGDPSAGAGWLVLNDSYQDVGFRTLFKCEGECETGVLFRMEETDAGYTGVFMSLHQNDLTPYRVWLNGQGEITSRERLHNAGGIWYRVAPEIDYDEVGEAPERSINPPRSSGPEDLPFDRPDNQFRVGDWNQVETFLEVNVIRSFLNDGSTIGGHTGSTSDGRSGLDGYGPIALYVGGQGEVRFAEVMWQDIAIRYIPDEYVSPRFSMQRVNDLYYSWGADAGDYNQNGVMDVVAGPYLFFGPDYTSSREIFPAVSGNPSLEFSFNRVQHSHDFTGNGWPDILATTFGNITLYVNPGEESRRWDSHGILPGVSQGEITILEDIDGDGTPELIYAAGQMMRFAKPNPEDATKPWIEYNVSEGGYGLSHGIGIGDINGNGRLDFVNSYGWWEQPAELDAETPWTYHPATLGRYGRRGNGIGGTVMAVYDVNGNGMNDVVTNLNAHGFGFAWFEQQRDQAGEISFTMHMINDDYSADNAGGVTFSQPHGATFADVDGDGIPDFIVGKRHWSHLDNYADPDPHGPPVLYWYRTVRDASSPGGARFEPNLIHNRSGAGSEIKAVDLNDNGLVDIITSTNRGTFIFWNTGEGDN